MKVNKTVCVFATMTVNVLKFCKKKNKTFFYSFGNKCAQNIKANYSDLSLNGMENAYVEFKLLFQNYCDKTGQIFRNLLQIFRNLLPKLIEKEVTNFKD